MSALLLAILALVLPAAFAGQVRERPGVASLLDGVVLGGIGALIAFGVLPEAAEASRMAAIGGLAVGLAFPYVAERIGIGGKDVDGASLVVGQLALALHAALDGASLSTGDARLTTAVLLHQAPVGLAVWASTRARFGGGAAWGALVAMAATTALGYAAGEGLFAKANPATLAGFQALAGGTLLHVVGHAPLAEETRPRAAGVGALVAFVAVAVGPGGHGEFPRLLYVAAPWVLAGGCVLAAASRSATKAARLTTVSLAVAAIVLAGRVPNPPIVGWRVACAGLVSIALAALLLREGPRGWLQSHHHPHD